MTLEEVKDTFEARQLEVTIALVGLILVGAGMFWWKVGGGQKSNVEILSASVEATGASNLVINQLMVDIAGAVQNPGLYKLPVGSRVEEAIMAAGGITVEADRNWIEVNLNRAAKLTDGAKIYIPSEGDKIPDFQSSTININTASQGELEGLPGIGPVTAGKIIGNRPYGDIDELISKKIVGQKVFDQIKEKISLW